MRTTGHERLRAWRKRKQLTQLSLCEMLGGIDQSQLSRVESGRQPGLVLALKIERLTRGVVPVKCWVAVEELAA